MHFVFNYVYFNERLSIGMFQMLPVHLRWSAATHGSSGEPSR